MLISAQISADGEAKAADKDEYEEEVEEEGGEVGEADR